MTKARDIASATTPNANAALLATFPHKNLIINGAMQVAQRGTSFTNPSSNSYTLDRWVPYYSHDGAVDISQSTTAPADFKNSLKMNVTTADASLAASQYYILAQVIEGQNVSHLNYGSSYAKQVTISFWVRSNKTGTYYVEIQTSGSQELSRAYTIDSANTWEYKTLTWIANTDFTISETNAVGLYLYWWLAAGSDYTGSPLATTWANNSNRTTNQENFLDSTSNDWYITGVQLELGSQATPFEHRSFGDELARCQRYFCKSYDYAIAVGASLNINNLNGAAATAGGTASANRPFWAGGPFPVNMRTAPTVTLYNVNGTSGKITGGSFASRDGAVTNVGERNFNVYNISGATADEDHYCIYAASAEL